MAIKNFEELKNYVSKLEPVRIAVAAAGSENVIRGVKLAHDLNIIKEPILTGEKDKIQSLVKKYDLHIKEENILHADNDKDAAVLAVKAVNDGKAEILAKGVLETVYYLKAIFDKENGIRKSKILNNLTLFEMDSYHKLIAISDNAIIPNPTLEEKVEIVTNTLPLWKAMEIENPKVAVLAAVEVVNSKMQATVDASCLRTMSNRNQIKNFVIDGPLAYDVAINKKAAESKGLIKSEVAGDPDLLLMPNLESANILGKSYKFHGNAKSGGMVFGAKVPVALNSRSDSAERRLLAIIIARAVANKI
ncbi:MAG: phosphate acyltransferase [Bacillota bacterium]